MRSREQGGRKGDDLFSMYCSDSGGPRGQLSFYLNITIKWKPV